MEETPPAPGRPTDDLTEIELLLDRVHREVSGIHSIMRLFRTIVLVAIALFALYILSVVFILLA